METIISSTSIRVPWNKGKLVGQKAPFKLKEIWGIRAEFSTLPTSLLGNTPESSILGFNFGVGYNQLWHAHVTQDEGDANIQTDQEPACCTVATRPLQARKYGAISRNRS
jgi:hypothetical protein